MPNSYCELPLSTNFIFLNSWCFYHARDQLDKVPPDAEELKFGNEVYTITFEDREDRPLFGHKYWFFLKDAVDDVPEYVVHWENFVE